MLETVPHPLDSATALVDALRRREVRSVDVTRAFLGRIAAGDHRIHCVTRVESESALRQAADADRRADAGGPLGPLHGLPMTLKDAHRVAGSRTTFGMPHFWFHRPKTDCEAVARLRRAGAVFLGRTAVPFGCWDWQCKPPFGRECVNQIDPTRTPGGTSGGAAVAAGFTPLELGSDIAGSNRYPAHCYGVYSLRTTVGLIPSDHDAPDGGPLLPTAYAAGRVRQETLPHPGGKDVWSRRGAPQTRLGGHFFVRFTFTTSTQCSRWVTPHFSETCSYLGTVSSKRDAVKSAAMPPSVRAMA